jgi:hypothetical protein
MKRNRMITPIKSMGLFRFGEVGHDVGQEFKDFNLVGCHSLIILPDYFVN